MSARSSRKFMLTIAILTLCTCLVRSADPPETYAATAAPNANSYVKPEPPYAKWGKVAVEQAQKCYPDARVIDYLHVRRRKVSPSEDEETFKLWLREVADSPKEWGVVVRIRFYRHTGRIRRISCIKVNR